jgi:hypothetical protein
MSRCAIGVYGVLRECAMKESVLLTVDNSSKSRNAEAGYHRIDALAVIEDRTIRESCTGKDDAR